MVYNYFNYNFKTNILIFDENLCEHCKNFEIHI